MTAHFTPRVCPRRSPPATIASVKGASSNGQDAGVFDTGVLGMVLTLAIGAAGCAPVDPVEIGDLDLPRAAERPRARSVEYELTWRGRPIGRAVETLEQTPGGQRLVRRETVAVKRSGTVVESELAISIDTDRQLRPRQVDVASRIGAT